MGKSADALIAKIDRSSIGVDGNAVVSNQASVRVKDMRTSVTTRRFRTTLLRCLESLQPTSSPQFGKIIRVGIIDSDAEERGGAVPRALRAPAKASERKLE